MTKDNDPHTTFCPPMNENQYKKKYFSLRNRILNSSKKQYLDEGQLMYTQLTFGTQSHHLLLFLPYLLYLHRPSHHPDPSTLPRAWAPRMVSLPHVLLPVPLRCFGANCLRHCFDRFPLPLAR